MSEHNVVAARCNVEQFDIKPHFRAGRNAS